MHIHGESPLTPANGAVQWGVLCGRSGRSRAQASQPLSPPHTRGISHFLREIPNVAFFSGMTQSVTEWLTAVRGRHGSCHRKGTASAREHVSPATALPGGSNRNLGLEICQKISGKGIVYLFFFKDKYAIDSVPQRDL